MSDPVRRGRVPRVLLVMVLVLPAPVLALPLLPVPVPGLGTGVATGLAGPGGPSRYQPPLVAPVVDPFRPPDQPWLAGNRGLEYDTVPGIAVGSIGPGLVVFAGAVAGSLYVTVLHPDGIRSSYSHLQSVTVAPGDRVRTGKVLGFTGATRFHLGARIGTTYIDPAGLFGTLVGHASVFLVPRNRPGQSGQTPERTLAGPGAVLDLASLFSALPPW